MLYLSDLGVFNYVIGCAVGVTGDLCSQFDLAPAGGAAQRKGI